METVFFALFLIAVLIAFIFIRHWTSRLAFQNRLLTALRRLDVAATSSVDIELLSQAIVEVIRQELGYMFGVIALADYELGVVRRIAISSSDELREILAGLPIKFNKQAVPFDYEGNLFIRVLKEKRVMFTNDLFDVQRGILPEELSKDIQNKLHLKGLFIYPMIAKGRVIGLIEYPIETSKEKVSKFEYTVMEEFTKEVARVLDNVLLYQNLREASEELTLANRKLKELDKLKDELISITSHELRTPMTAIRSYVWMALHRSDIPLSQKLERYLYRTLVSTERLINLVSDMLNVSTIESAKMEINPKPFDIVSLVKDVMEEVKAKADEKKLQLIILEHFVPQVFADSDKVHQVLLNLIGNALKFTFPGGTITVDFFTDGRIVEISVKDNGQGLSKSDLDKLFHKFYRLNNSYTVMSASGGTGLGLYISKSLVELMHGSIRAESDGENKGATFSFSLPIATEERVKHESEFHVKVEGRKESLEPVII